MLKFTYTETGLQLEHLTQSLEEWVTLRVILSIRAGRRLSTERTTASMLLPCHIAEVQTLNLAIGQEEGGAIEWGLCDADYIEVVFSGTWVTSCPDGDDGIFVTTLSHRTEFLILKLWHAAQMHISSLR